MKRLGLILLYIAAWGLLFSSATGADEKQSYNLDEIIVTATKTPKKLENVPAVVTIIGSEEIESKPARTVGDLLADLPGFSVNEPQGVGLITPQTVSLRGNGFTGHTLILLNGQRMNSPANDYTYLTTLPVRAVERIEVVRGPFSSLYGSSGGAGVINIITKDGGDRTYVQTFGQIGDFGRHDYGLDVGMIWKNLSLGLFYDRKNVDNYYLYDDKGLDDSNREYTHDRIHGKLTGTLGDKTEFNVSGGTVEGTTNYGFGDNLGIERYKDINQPYLNFGLSSRLSEKFEFKAQADWLKSKSSYIGETLVNVTYPSFGPPIPSFNYSPSVNHTQAQRYRGDVTLNWYLLPDQIMTIGSELIYNKYEKSINHSQTGEFLEVQGRQGEITDKDDTLYSLYAQYDGLFFDCLEIVLGARFDDYDSYGSQVSPKGTLRWQYRKGGNFKFSVGKGFRAPNLNQLYSSPWSISPLIVYQGNPDLKAETLVSYELSLEQYALDRALFFRVTPYYTDANNFITSIRIPDPVNPTSGQIMYPDNVDEVEIKGVDLEISYKVLPPLTLFANYNYNETRDAKTDMILNGYPRNTGALGLRGNHRLVTDWRLFGSYAARYRGEWDDTSWGRNTVTETVGGYWWHTASVGIAYKEMLSLKINGFNLFDDRTQTGIDDYPAQRNVLVELALKYTF